MLLKVNHLKEGIHNFNIDEPVENVGLEEPFFDKVNVVLSLHKLHNQIILETRLKLKAHFDCDRCNASYDVQLNADYKMVYLFGRAAEREEDALNVVYLPIDASSIKLDDDIRDYAMLAIPMKKLCKEDCKGLCPTCGKNLNDGPCDCEFTNIDDRWISLQELKKKINNN